MISKAGADCFSANTTDPIWRNDFCRLLSTTRYAFAGIPTLMRECSPEGVPVGTDAMSDLMFVLR
jgi:hypothetical protein